MDGTRPKFGLHDSIGHHVTLAARQIERRVEDGLRAHKLTRTGWCVLVAVEEDGLKNPSEIAEFVGIDRTATSRILRQLEEEGLIARQMGQTDRRTTEVVLTDLGRNRMKDAMPICQENIAHYTGKLTAAEIVELKRILLKLRD